MKKNKLRLTKHTIRQLTNLSLDDAKGGYADYFTKRCASKKKVSGCPCAAA